MSETTPTSRTDAEMFWNPSVEDATRSSYVVEADFARTLERELAAARAEVAELTENLEKKSIAIQRIWKERDDLRAEVEGLRAALTSVFEICDSPMFFIRNGIEGAEREAWDAARAALA